LSFSSLDDKRSRRALLACLLRWIPWYTYWFCFLPVSVVVKKDAAWVSDGKMWYASCSGGVRVGFCSELQGKGISNASPNNIALVSAVNSNVLNLADFKKPF
jgi:hypothetical protein